MRTQHARTDAGDVCNGVKQFGWALARGDMLNQVFA